MRDDIRERATIREWRDSDHSGTDDTGIIRALDTENAKLKQRNADLRAENIQLRAALTAAQLALDALEVATGRSA